MSTYTPIATQTLASAAPSVTFSSIPQGYTDLIISYNATSSTEDQNFLQYNADTGSNYSRTFLSGNGSSATSNRSTNDTKLFGPFSMSVPTVNLIQIQNYSNGTTFKTTLIRSGAANNSTIATVGLYRSTAPITSVLIGTNSGTFNSGTVFTLYGIQVGDKAQKAQGGNIVTSDGTYVYHTFTSSGAFIPNQALTVDYLVVAGGGSGGSNNGAGGGAGGLRSTVTATGGGGSLESPLSLTAQAYTVSVGAGGASIASGQVDGNPGNNSVFATITSTGGGYGAGYVTSRGNATVQPGGPGGSSGGGAGTNGAGGGGGAGAGGSNASGTADSVAGTRTASPVQGNNGGSGGNGNTGGAGGAGVAVSITGSSVTYAGGGGGSSSVNQGAGGSGGGSAGANTTASNATVNTGGGGGGSHNTGGTGAGGSGIVIIRYLA